MTYPKNLKNNSKIGIVAMSSGVGNYEEEFEKSIETLKEYGYSILETKNVRSKKEPSTTAPKRAKELEELVENKEVDAILCAAGGDFQIETIPYIKFDSIEKNPKWIMGASDPTSLLYIVTTKLDIATIYGHNAGSFDTQILHESQKIAINSLRGKPPIQKSYDYYEKDRESRTNRYFLNEKVLWKSNRESFEVEGRIIGGCIDCLRDLPGTPYDYTKDFINRYKEDGIIWYFDIFSLSCEDFYRTLFQMKESGWFQYVKGVIAGRVRYPSGYTDMTYQKALEKIFKNVPIIWDADIGHVPPKMTIINGSIASITYKNHKGQIELKYQ